MSYEKTVWSAGDTITAEKLNNIETGIEAADKPVYAPEPVTGEGDVSITYNGNQIGVLSESGTLMLDTDGKVVEHDIVVDYTKPDPEPLTIPIYTQVGEADRVAQTPITGIPGAQITKEYPNIIESEPHSISCSWVGNEGPISVFGANVEFIPANHGYPPNIGFACYMPNTISNGATYVLIEITPAE